MSDAALSLSGQSPGMEQDVAEGLPVSLQQEMEPSPQGKWELKKLTQRHKDICALIAQGIKRQQIASICEVTPEYVTMLARQPKCIQYIQEMNAYAAVQLDAMFVKTVDVINEAMDCGSTEEKLRAARLQLEVTKRIGRPDPSAGQGAVNADERLLTLAERLTGLLSQKKAEQYEGQIEDAEFRELPKQDQAGT